MVLFSFEHTHNRERERERQGEGEGESLDTARLNKHTEHTALWPFHPLRLVESSWKAVMKFHGVGDPNKTPAEATALEMGRGLRVVACAVLDTSELAAGIIFFVFSFAKAFGQSLAA